MMHGVLPLNVLKNLGQQFWLTKGGNGYHFDIYGQEEKVWDMVEFEVYLCIG